MPVTVFYIGPYCEQSQGYRNLLVQPSGLAKMDYILSALQRSGFEVNLYSPAPTQNSYFCHYPAHITQLEMGGRITYADTIGGPTLFFKALARMWSLVQLFFFLLRIKPDENVLVYHVYQYRFAIRAALFFRKINLFFEVEELYSVLWQRSVKNQDTEKQYLDIASGYIFVNDVISAQCGLSHKPGVVCYGDYRVKTYTAKKDDGHIHMVYSGIIGTEGSAVYLALNTIHLLPVNYQLHITGYGGESDTKRLSELVEKTNMEINREAVVYHGCLNSVEYLRLISSFHIGLATTELTQFESLFMFPSKVLIYLGANLSVVASPLACIEQSLLKKVITISDDNTPSSMAKAILSTKVRGINHEAMLDKLDGHFIADLQRLFIK